MRNKKLFVIAVMIVFAASASAWADVEINTVNFPDEIFRNYISENVDRYDPKGFISDAEINAATTMDLFTYTNNKTQIKTLKGIEHFTALTTLICSRNTLEDGLDVSKNRNLVTLKCANNGLTELDLHENKSLKELDCPNNNLKLLDLSANEELETLDCSGNSLAVLNLSANTKLSSLTMSQTITLASVSYDAAEEYPYSINLNQYERYIGGSVPAFMANAKISETAGKGIRDIYDAPLTDYVINDSGIIRFSSKPRKIIYNYNTSNANKLMEVTLEFTDLEKAAGDINITDFADNAFISYATTNFDKNGDGILSETEIHNATNLDVRNTAIDPQKVQAILEKFPYLETLNCSRRQISTLDLSKNTKLKTLDCSENNITVLDLSRNTALTSLTCSNNSISGLDVSKNTALVTLKCENNSITALDVSKNTALTTLYCRNNAIKKLDLSNNKVLTDLDCSGNNIAAINLSQNTALTARKLSDPDQEIALNIEHVAGTRYSIRLKDYDANIDVNKINSVFKASDNLSISDYTKDSDSGTISFATGYERIKYIYQVATDISMTVYASITYVERPAPNPPASSLPTNLLNNIASLFGVDPSSVHSLSDSEKTYDADKWTLGTADQNTLNASGETVIQNLPVFTPSESGIYVIECNLGTQNAGKQLNFHGVTSDWQVSGTAFGETEYRFFNAATYEEVTDAPSDGKIYVALRVSAGEQKAGVITHSSSTGQSTIEPVPVASRDVIRRNIASALNISPDKIVFLDRENISPAPGYAGQIRPASVRSAAEGDNEKHYEIVSGLGTIHDFKYDADNRYVMEVKLLDDVPSEVNAKSLSDDIISDDVSGDIRVYTEASNAAASINASFFGYGLINTFEVLTLEGKKLEPKDFGIREFLMIAIFQSSTPFTIFLAKFIPGLGGIVSAIIGGGGCDAVSGGIVLAVFLLFRRKH